MSNTRIGVDLTFIDYHGHGEEVKVGSLTIYASTILNAIKAMNKHKDFVLFCRFCDLDFFKREFNDFIIEPITPFLSKVLYTFTKAKKLGGKFFWHDKYYKKIVKKYDLKTIWFPFATHKNFMPGNLGISKILTVHDIFTYHRGDGKAFFETVFADTSNKFVVVSDYTKQDIIKTLGHSDAFVIHPPIELQMNDVQKIESQETGFILDINSYTPRKNTITLLKAFDLIKEKTTKNLVLCGGQKDDEYYKSLTDYVEKNNLSDRVKFYFAIPEGQKNWLMLNSSLFVNPSTFEGFGRTPVDAALCKIPVISSKDTSLYEATMGLVNYYEDSLNEKELSEVILKVLNDKQDNLDEIANSLKEAYKAENIAKEYLEVLRT